MPFDVRSIRLLLPGLLALSAVVLAAASHLAAPWPWEASANVTAFTVNSPADPGDGLCDPTECTLREAINAANGSAGSSIEFAIPGCPPACVITLAGGLPAAGADYTLVDGTTQPGYSGTPLVILDGSNAVYAMGLTITGTHTTVKGLRVQNFDGAGIATQTADDTYGDNRIEGNVATNNHIGIYLEGLRIVVLDNEVYSNDAEGILGAGYGQRGIHDAVIHGNTVTGNGASGIAASGHGMTFAGNVVTGNAGNGINSMGNTDDVTVSGNVVTGNGGAGIAISGAGTSMTGNTASQNADLGIGLYVYPPSGGGVMEANIISGNGAGYNGVGDPPPGVSVTGDAVVRGNSITGNAGPGVKSEDDAPQAHFNRIVDNGSAAEHQGTGGLNAENNWWGCDEGPANPGCGNTSGAVDYSPWLVLRLTPATASLPIGGTVDLTADVVMNSDAADTSGDGRIPDGAEVLFETDLGNVGSPSVVKPLADGEAVATLVPDVPGTAHVSATLDSATVQVEITITGGATSTPTPTPTGEPTETPTTTPTATPASTATPTPTPTPSPGGTLGDTDCDGDVDAVDALMVLRETAGLPNSAACIAAGDVDCDGDRDAVDALFILRHVAGLPETPGPGCGPIGGQETMTNMNLGGARRATRV